MHNWLYALMSVRTAVKFGMNWLEMKRFGVFLVGCMLKFLSCVRCFLPDYSRSYWQYSVAGVMQCGFKLCRVKCGSVYSLSGKKKKR